MKTAQSEVLASVATSTKARFNLARLLTPNTVLVATLACLAGVTGAAAFGAAGTEKASRYPASIEYASHSMTGKEFMALYCSEPESSDICVTVAQSMKASRELKADKADQADQAVQLAKSQRTAPAVTNP